MGVAVQTGESHNGMMYHSMSMRSLIFWAQKPATGKNENTLHVFAYNINKQSSVVSTLFSSLTFFMLAVIGPRISP